MTLSRLASSVSPCGFRRFSLAVSAAWLLCIYPLLNFFAWNHLPLQARSNGSDFSQYYSGALAVRLGLRESLYPEPNAGVYSGNPSFRPHFITPLFDPADDISRNGKWAFYPQVAEPGASNVPDQLTTLCPRLQGDWHYIYPPPLALLLTPLALFDYDTACRGIWFTLMCTSLFGISYFASRICRTLFPGETYAEGFSALLPAIPTWLASGLGTSLSIGNVSPLIGFLITLVSFAFLTNRQILIGLGTIPLILLKGIGILWCPLLLLGKIKWRTLFVMAFLTVALNALTLHLGGIGLYQTFFSEILPKASVPLGIGLPGMLMSAVGVDARSAATILNLGFVLVIYHHHFKALRRDHDAGLVTLTTIVATMALFNLLNTVVWPHYFTNYLILPFAPWIMREISLRRGWTRIFLSAFALASVLCWFDSLFLIKKSFLVEFLKDMNLYLPAFDLIRKTLSGISFYVIPNAVSAMVLILAIRRLMAWSSSKPASEKPAFAS